MREPPSPEPRDPPDDLAAGADPAARHPHDLLDDLLWDVEEYGFVLLDDAGRITGWNRGAERIMGFTAGEAVGAEYEALVPREETAAEQSVGDRGVRVFDGSRTTKAEGSLWLHEVTYRLSRTGRGTGRSLRIVHDIESRLESVRALRESEQHHRRLVEWSPESILLHDGERILYANQAARRLFRTHPEDELVGRPLGDYLEPDDREGVVKLVRTAMEEHVPAGPVELRVPGRGLTLELTMVPAHFGGRRVAQLIAHDVSARKEMELQLQHQAFHDFLTRLPNRALFQEHLERAIAAVQRHPERELAVLFLDLDGFKQVNDTWGHQVGDRLLVEFAARLRGSVRPQDVVARLAGDEFTVLLEDLSSQHEAVGVAERIQRECGGVYRLMGEQVRVSVSLGIALFTPESTSDSLLQAADVALYRAKRQGGAAHSVYDEKLHRSVMQRLRLESELREAVAGEGLQLAYEPLHRLAGGEPAGVAAVLKWEHPEIGAVPEGEILGALAALGLLSPVADWALARIAHEAAEWKERLGAGALLQLHWPLLQPVAESPASLARLAAQLAPLRPVVGVPETVLAQSGSSLRPLLDALRAHDFAVVVTDFGAGSLSISDLERLGAVGLEVGCGAAAGVREPVLRGVVGMARGLGLRVTAAGLSSDAAWERATAAGFDYGRGSRARDARRA